MRAVPAAEGGLTQRSLGLLSKAHISATMITAMPRTCPHCGHTRFEARWQGLSCAVRCACCHDGAVTTRWPPIQQDQGPYRIVITGLGDAPQRTLIALNQRFSHGIAQTRALFSGGDRTLVSGTALAIWQEAQRLRSEGVPFRIEPDYPYDLATYDPEHAHEHEWMPVEACD